MTIHSPSMKTVLVTGGAGYKECVHVPKLLAAGYGVVVYDLMLFGSAGLPSRPNLKVVTGDIRDTANYAAAVKGCDYVIHMACISNDPSFDLDPSLSRTIMLFGVTHDAVREGWPRQSRSDRRVGWD